MDAKTEWVLCHFRTLGHGLRKKSQQGTDWHQAKKTGYKQCKEVVVLGVRSFGLLLSAAVVVAHAWMSPPRNTANCIVSRRSTSWTWRERRQLRGEVGATHSG